VTEDRSAADRELARLRAKSGEQELEIARLRDEAAEASGELTHLGVKRMLILTVYDPPRVRE
jgi:hypothetical protein